MKSPLTLTRGASTTLVWRLDGVLADHGELVEQDRRERRVDVNDGVVFVLSAVVGGAGQRLSADALVLPGPLFVAVLRVGGVLIAELVSERER